MTKPVILLIGGATGTGKSTVAAEVAHRLGITRVTSTDVVRQTLRAFFGPGDMPSIHRSSFDPPAGESLVEAFLEQTENVLVAVEAAVERALHEEWSMVLEGVHLVPGMLPRIEGALVVQCVLAIEDETAHASHFWVRDAVSEGVRPVEKYLNRLSEIRTIQDYIVDRSRKSGVPVVENRNIELAIATVMELVFAGAERMERVG